VEHGPEGFGAEARVEVLAEGGDHRRRVTRGEGGGQLGFHGSGQAADTGG
jgi:hypothetical protein